MTFEYGDFSAKQLSVIDCLLPRVLLTHGSVRSGEKSDVVIGNKKTRRTSWKPFFAALFFR